MGGHHRVWSRAATVCNCTLEAGVPAAHTGCHAWTREVLIAHRLAHQILWGGVGSVGERSETAWSRWARPFNRPLASSPRVPGGSEPDQVPELWFAGGMAVGGWEDPSGGRRDPESLILPLVSCRRMGLPSPQPRTGRGASSLGPKGGPLGSLSLGIAQRGEQGQVWLGPLWHADPTYSHRGWGRRRAATPEPWSPCLLLH